MINFLAIFRRRPNPAITELASSVDALFTRIDIMRRNLHHAQARATLLESRNRGLVATVSDQALTIVAQTTTIESLQAQLAAARSLIDRRTVALRIAEEAWTAEAQRVIDLEDEARDWITRAREPAPERMN